MFQFKGDYGKKLRVFLDVLEKGYLWFLFVLACAFGAYIWYTSLYLLGKDESLIMDLMNKDIFIDLDEKRFDEYSKMIDRRTELFGSNESPKTNIFSGTR